MTAPDPRLEEIEGRLSKATPGPWEANKNGTIDGSDYAEVICHGQVDCMAYCYGGSSVIEGDNLEADAEFIAAAPADVAYLLAELRKAQDKLADVLAIADIGMNSKHGDPAFIQGWECAIEEIKARNEPGDKS